MTEDLSAVTSTLPPADLEIHVTTRHDGDALSLDYVLNSPNSRLDLSKVEFHGKRLRRLDAWQERNFKTLENLHRGLDSRGTPITVDEVASDFARLGETLYEDLFPEAMQQIWQRIILRAETMLLVSDEPWIPWEMVKPYDGNSASDEDDGFLAGRFQFTRWFSGRAPSCRILVPRLTVIEAGSPPEHRPLVKAADELMFVQELAKRNDIEVDSLADATHAEVLTHLSEHDLGLLHLVGHGEHNPTDVENSGFCLHDGRMLRPLDLHRRIQGRFAENRPVVFLNACESGRQGWSLTRIGGWPQSFIKAGCSAFIAPQWTVNDADAHMFAKVFYDALEGDQTFGMAALKARRALPKNSLGRLAYTVYSHPNSRLHLGSQTSPQETPPSQPRSIKSTQETPPSQPRSITFHKPSFTQSDPALTSTRQKPIFVLAATSLIFVLLLTMIWSQFDDRWSLLSWIRGNETTSRQIGDDELDRGPARPSDEKDLLRPEIDTASTLTTDISDLQKPPYRSRAVNFSVRWPTESDLSIWMAQFENTAKAELIKYHLSYSTTTSSAWLVLVELSLPEFKEERCTVQADFSIYHKQRGLAGPESIAKTAKGFTEDTACKNVVHKVAEHVSRRVTKSYNDQTSEE